MFAVWQSSYHGNSTWMANYQQYKLEKGSLTLRWFPAHGVQQCHKILIKTNSIVLKTKFIYLKQFIDFSVEFS